MPGYSGTPLAKKLGLKEGITLWAINAPSEYERWLDPIPTGARIVSVAPRSPTAVHAFVTKKSDLVAVVSRLRKSLAPTGFLWVSWPKKAAKVETDITEDTIREIALPTGFVDVKVCAVSDVWSGLKLMIRKTER